MEIVQSERRWKYVFQSFYDWYTIGCIIYLNIGDEIASTLHAACNGKRCLFHKL